VEVDGAVIPGDHRYLGGVLVPVQPESTFMHGEVTGFAKVVAGPAQADEVSQPGFDVRVAGSAHAPGYAMLNIIGVDTAALALVVVTQLYCAAG